MIKKIYKPKAKNEIALKTYIKNATKNSNEGHRRNTDSKCDSSRGNDIR